VTRLRSAAGATGELRFTVGIAGREHEIWLTSSAGVTAGAEAAAVATLLPAMAVGERLELDVPVAQATVDALRDAQAIVRSWVKAGADRGAFPFSREIEIVPLVEPEPPSPAPRPAAVGAFFSGGIDSLSTVLEHPEITHLVHVEGFDVALERRDLADRVGAELQAAAAELGRELIVVRTNLRELSDPHVPWSAYFGGALGMVALTLSDVVGRMFVASGLTHAGLEAHGSHPLLDHVWGAGRIEIVHEGADRRRVDKVRKLAAHPVARRRLRVCWQNPDGDYNCGRCEKCLRTLTALELLGARSEFSTFPEGFSTELVAATRPGNRFEVDFWRDNLELAVQTGARLELIEAIEACLANASPSTRALPAAGRWASRRPTTEPMLHMRPETFAELRRRDSAVILIGSYDGSGNYGDVAQLDSALRLVDALGTSTLALPVVDLRYLEGHRRIELPATSSFDPEHVLVFAYPSPDADRGMIDEGLVPALMPASIAFAGTYMYGGGFLNRRWADRMLEMIGATAELDSWPGVEERLAVSSGLQIEPGWARSLSPEARGLLRGFVQIGVRDELSLQAAADVAGAHGEPRVVNTGDDAVGSIARALDGGPEPPADRTPTVNLHLCVEPWVTDDPDRLVGFVGKFLDALAAELGRPLRIQPLVAYDDGRINERPRLESLLARYRDRATVAEPIALQPATLADSVGELRRATLTVSCSYHVSLTSLLAGVPAVLLMANPYYAQKAGGLRRDFPIGDEFFCDTDSDPERAAAAVIARLGPAVGGALASARKAVLDRRAQAERDLVQRLAEASDRARRGGEGARRPPAEPWIDPMLAAWRKLHDDRMAVIERAEWERARAEGLQGLLSAIESSSSWRLTRPFRAAKEIVRRRG
jgi:hypothetical protein